MILHELMCDVPDSRFVSNNRRFVIAALKTEVVRLSGRLGSLERDKIPDNDTHRQLWLF